MFLSGVIFTIRRGFAAGRLSGSVPEVDPGKFSVDMVVICVFFHNFKVVKFSVLL